jgi:type II secretory pathway pseudopilin PulG
MKNYLRTCCGVTLIEAVLTIAIIGAGLLGVMYMFSGGTRSSLLADQNIVAANLAREKIEQIIADRANKGYATTIATSYSDGQLTGSYSVYTRNVTIQEKDPDADGGDDDFLDNCAIPACQGYARVTVTVSWNGGNNIVKEETLIADYTMP